MKAEYIELLDLMRDTEERGSIMRIYTETSLNDFTYWGGAGDTYMQLTDVELEYIEEYLEDSYSDGMSDTDLNDFMWFERDFIAELLGYEDWVQLEDNQDKRWAD